MTTAINTSHLMFLLTGVLWTAVLSGIAFCGGGALGLLVALGRTAPLKWLRIATAIYVNIVQGTPLLVVLFLVYFGLPTLGLEISPLVAAGLSLTIYVSAYLGEIWRGCLESVPKAQWEAAECLALSRSQRLFKVILPQAIRIATPPTVGFSVQIIKNTSLASAVGFIELTRAGQLINNSIFEPFLIYLAVAFLYFCLCFPVSAFSQRLEQRGSRIRVRGTTAPDAA
jgi:polar amino acid transport system permease protein